MSDDELPPADEWAEADSAEEFEEEDQGLDEFPSDDLTDWGGGELESAYLKALSALDAVESEIPVAEARSRSDDDDEELEVADEESDSIPEGSESVAEVGEAVDAAKAEIAVSDPAALQELLAPAPQEVVADPVATTVDSASLEATRPTPRQIIEACLFVGGTPLAATKLSGVLRGEFSTDYIDREIDDLNRLYAAEGRPYEIRLGEGGYRMALREEFERIRHKVYGLGPKEVRLSQDALEVLSVVAYHQPIKQARVEELGKPGCGAVLRQLVRRELLSVERDPTTPREVNYKTTPRFLSLFGIRNLDELPRHEQVSYK